jgi:hypothetical protein
VAIRENAPRKHPDHLDTFGIAPNPGASTCELGHGIQPSSSRDFPTGKG